MVRLLSRSRMVAIMPSIEGHAPASLTLRVLDGPILWLSDDAGEFASRDFHPVPWGEPDRWERGAEASIFRIPSRCEAEFQPARAENPGSPNSLCQTDNAVVAQFTIEYRPEHRNPTRQEVKACPKLLERTVSPFLDSARWVAFSCRHFAVRTCCS